jgi:hypothetical protein
MSSIETIAYPEHFRAEVQKRISALLLLQSGSDTDNTISSNIEKGIFNWTIKHATKNNIVKKRFELISSNVKTRIKNELCCACKQPRTSMVMPCLFLKADCGHFIDGNCKDKQLEVKKKEN